MNKPLHTPKGWVAVIGADHTILCGSDGDPICAMKRNTGDRSEAEQDANAHMIAACVDLYEALVAARTDLVRELNGWLSLREIGTHPTIVMIDRALAKSRGDQP